MTTDPDLHRTLDDIAADLAAVEQVLAASDDGSPDATLGVIDLGDTTVPGQLAELLRSVPPA